MAPTEVNVCHASLTVVGETPSDFDSSRTVGSRVPTARSPRVIILPTAAAIPRALRSTIASLKATVIVR
jgi:hypothetical protein